MYRLERKVGITTKKLIECHGTSATFHCMSAGCKKKCKLEKVWNDVAQGRVPYCGCRNEGVLKPDITFFGENLPLTFMKSLDDGKILECDLVLVIGTSLKVGGSVHEVLRSIGNLERKVPFILINKDPVILPKSVLGGFDAQLLGLCDDICRYLAVRCFPLPPPSSSFSSINTKSSADYFYDSIAIEDFDCEQTRESDEEVYCGHSPSKMNSAAVWRIVHERNKKVMRIKQESSKEDSDINIDKFKREENFVSINSSNDNIVGSDTKRQRV